MTGDGVEARLRAGLKDALRARDQAAVRALRTAVAAVENAAAPPVEQRWQEPVPGQANELPRLLLGEDDVVAIVEREVADRREAIVEYHRIGQADAADALRAEVLALEAVLRQTRG